MSRIATFCVFFSGLFFGGAIDHSILALAGRTDTPYGVDVGVTGNWAMAVLDVVLTAGLWKAHLKWSSAASSR